MAKTTREKLIARCKHITDFHPMSDSATINLLNDIVKYLQEPKNDEVMEILKESKKITKELLLTLEKAHNVEFEIVTLPRYNFPNRTNKIRVFMYEGKIFL